MPSKFILVCSLGLSLISFAAKTDCTDQVNQQLMVYFEEQGFEELDFDGLNQISYEEAAKDASSQGWLEGEQLAAALSKLEVADQIFRLWSAVGNGSATDLVVVKNSCEVTDIIRIQVE